MDYSKKKKQRTGGLVYSTEHGKSCPNCRQAIATCNCIKQKPEIKTDGILRIYISTKGRQGKGVSVVTGLTLNNQELKDLAKHLKQKCGSGGTVKENTIEIQGDHRELLMNELQKKGYTVKLAGS